MDAYSDRTKFQTITIEFADLSAKEDFKRLTNTDLTHNRALDFEFIFPIPRNLSFGERCIWRSQVWGSDAMDCQGETMKEDGNIITYEFTTKVGVPIEFVRNLYLYSRIKKASIHCLDGCDLVYANSSRTAACRKKACDHDWCEMVFQVWEAKYDWSRLPHPLLQVNTMLEWIKAYFHAVDDTDAAMIYHQFLCELFKFKKFSESPLVQEARIEFEEQTALCGNAYLQTMVMLNDYERSPKFVFTDGQRILYKDAIDYYLKKTQPVREVPRFPKKENKK